MYLGDVFYKNNNVFGDGVNIVFCIEFLGIFGFVLFFKMVWNQVKNKVEFIFNLVGFFYFKNIVELMEVFVVVNIGFVVFSVG